METARPKVVPIRQADNNMTMDKKKLVHSSLTLLDAYLKPRVPAHFVKAEEIVSDIDNSDYSGDVLDDIKALKGMAQRLSTSIIEGISKKILHFSGEIEFQKNDGSISLASVNKIEELTLLPVDEVENKLLLEAYVSTCERKVSKQLHALRIRLEFIADVDALKDSSNPFGPSVLLNIYADLMQLELFSKKTLDLLYRCFCDVVLSDLGDLLDDINQLFIDAGVIPKIPIKKSSSAFSEKTFSPQIEQIQQQAILSQNFSAPMNGVPMVGAQGSTMQGFTMEPALYGSLLEMAKAYRVSGGEQVVSDGLLVSGEQLATGELLSALTHIQKTDVAAGVDSGISVRSQIGAKIQVDGQRQPYEEQDDTLIDVVAMFFDVILQDRHLPDVVRAMIAQLQIPILKVAMMDKEFFAKKSHPARQFLNALSHAGLGVSEKNVKIKSAVFEKMEELVARVLMDFDNDVGIFAELFEEFEVFMGQQQRQIDLIEERSRTATKSSEQLELTKRKAAYEIALRLKGCSIPEFVQLFLDDAWKDVLVLALLRHEREPQEVDKCMRVIERLVNSVSKPANNQEKESLLADLGRLLKDIKVGLENISYDFHQSAPFFKELESWHRQLLLLDANAQEEERDVDDVMMVDFDEELSMESLEASLLQELGDTLSAMPKDKFSKWTNNMQVGDWIEYSNAEDEVLRAKLSWKSSVTSNCLFVDARGGKALDISLADFAEELRSKRIHLLGQENAPLVERVLLGMKSFIKGDATETSLA